MVSRAGSLSCGKHKRKLISATRRRDFASHQPTVDSGPLIAAMSRIGSQDRSVLPTRAEIPAPVMAATRNWGVSRSHSRRHFVAVVAPQILIGRERNCSLDRRI